MIYFPQIGLEGAATQLPFTISASFRTSLNQLRSGSGFAYANRSVPKRRFDLNFPALRESEAESLRQFFVARSGPTESFTLLDPAGNLTLRSEEFQHSSWEHYDVSGGTAVRDPFGGMRALELNGTGANAMLATSVLPDGGASGIRVCGSVYAKAAAPGQTLVIGFLDSGFQLLSSSRKSLTPGRWTRLWCGAELATNSPVRLLIGGLGSWSGAALQLFGAQCAPLLGPGAYMRSPEFYGLRRHCRFASERLQVRRVEPGRVSVHISVEETVER